MGRLKIHSLPAYMTFDRDRGGYAVRNPLSGKKQRFSLEQAQ
jgi:hypothetical protein